MNGECIYGRKCWFLHESQNEKCTDEKRVPRKCRYGKSCRYIKNCKFDHEIEEVRTKKEIEQKQQPEESNQTGLDFLCKAMLEIVNQLQRKKQ